ncbi:hypothetical protein ACF0H5_015240 [Mactra antiquata]
MQSFNTLWTIYSITLAGYFILTKVSYAGVITTDSSTSGVTSDVTYDNDDDVTYDNDEQTTMKIIKLWPNGIIPYLMPDDMYDTEQKGRILSGMKRWEYKTCIKFVPWTDQLQNELGETRYIKFFSAGSCFSRTGLETFQPQLFGLGKGCLKMFTIIHELGHSIGMVHTMERIDRDLYIDINYDNINEASRRNFDTTLSRDILYNTYNTPYDYKSIMHYGVKSWSKNKLPTMVTKDPAYQHIIGKVNDVSFYDALYVNRAYNCSRKCPVAFLDICKHGGFLGGPDCRCICQDGYAGQFCEVALSGFQHIVEWQCQKGWSFHEGKCYQFVTDKIISHDRAKTSCMLANSTLVTFKGRPEMEWMNHKVSETTSMTGKQTFWIGMIKEQDTSTEFKWLDGTIVNTNIVSVTDKVGKEHYGCAKFNGETVSIDNCTIDEDNGYICEKDFDSTCGGRYMVHEDIVTIQTPGFPNGFPPDIACTYILQTNEDSRIRVKFDTFNLDTRGSDVLDVLLNNDVTSEKQSYTKTSLNGQTLESDGNLVILEFKSDSRISIAGFKATVTEIKSAAATTVSPYPLLKALYNVFDNKQADNNDKIDSMIFLKEIFNIFNSLTFSDLF